jgi:hypothetical protein
LPQQEQRGFRHVGFTPSMTEKPSKATFVTIVLAIPMSILANLVMRTVFLFLFGVLVNTKKYGKPCAFQFLEAISMKNQAGGGSDGRQVGSATHC